MFVYGEFDVFMQMRIHADIYVAVNATTQIQTVHTFVFLDLLPLRFRFSPITYLGL